MSNLGNLGNRFLRIAVVYFFAGVLLGIVMAAHQEFTLRPVHAHINLLGWVSLALFGLFYRSQPAAADSRLARVHFWLYNLALPVQMTMLVLFLRGNASVEPVLAAASIAVGVAVLCFAINLWKYTR
jgi:cbb3-type cytochrome oxidase subunit 1